MSPIAMDQSRWMQLMPSPIAMAAIDANIARCQSAREASPSNATRKAVQGSLTNKRDKSVVSNTMKLIPHVENRHRCVNRCDVSTKNATMKLGDPRTGSLGQFRQIHTKISRDESVEVNNKTCKKRAASSKKQHVHDTR